MKNYKLLFDNFVVLVKNTYIFYRHDLVSAVQIPKNEDNLPFPKNSNSLCGYLYIWITISLKKTGYLW